VAAMATNSPLDGVRSVVRFTIEDRNVASTNVSAAHVALASTDYFAAMGIPLVRGRLVTDQDDQTAPAVALVNETLARGVWFGQDPIGKRLKFGGVGSTAPWLTVVGVVRDVKIEGLERENRPQIYRPLMQTSNLALTLVVRGAADPARLGEAIRREVLATDARIPVYGIRTMEQAVDKAVAERRFAMRLLGLFAGVALLLSALGIYGVMAYAVTQRTQEIGIRVALGARRVDVHRLIIGQGLAMSIAGIIAGLAIAVPLTRAMSSLLFGVTATDPATFATVAMLLAAVAVFACYLPARRAAAVQPMQALRHE
jgi:predicted permease